MLGILRNLYPDRKLPEDMESYAKDLSTVPNKRAEEMLKSIKGMGWTGLEGSVREGVGRGV